MICKFAMKNASCFYGRLFCKLKIIKMPDEYALRFHANPDAPFFFCLMPINILYAGCVC